MSTTTRKRRIPRRPTIEGDIAAKVEEYLLNRSLRERGEYHEADLKRLLMQILETGGDEIEEGKQRITLDEPMAFIEYKSGKPKDRRIGAIERRQRKANRLDEDRALAFLAAHKNRKLIDACTTTVVVVDEDAILAANYAGDISDKDLAALYEETTTYAFHLIEEGTS
jgi:hypothetical protein